MSALPQHQWTAAEYLTFERESTVKHEFIDGQVVAMSGASRNHNLIAGNVTGLMFNQLAERPCEHYPSDMRVHVPATGLYTYPDVSVMCGEAELQDDEFDTLLNPTVIIEVLSRSTERYDRGTKFRDYRSIPSLQQYVLISQDRPHIEYYTRQDDGGWLLHDASGLDAVVELSSIGCKLRLKDVYRKVSFEDEIPTDGS